MEINDKLPDVYTRQVVTKDSAAENVSGKPLRAAAGDRVTLSVQSLEMQAAHKAIDQMPDVDLERVSKIRAQLKNGTYQVDAPKIAATMLAEALIRNS